MTVLHDVLADATAQITAGLAKVGGIADGCSCGETYLLTRALEGEEAAGAFQRARLLEDASAVVLATGTGEVFSAYMAGWLAGFGEGLGVTE